MTAALRRRDVLAVMAGGAAGAFTLAGWPGAVFAAAATEQRFVVVLLRGALDGLAAVPPIGDPLYRDKRGAIALNPPGAGGGTVALDGIFALNPGLVVVAITEFGRTVAVNGNNGTDHGTASVLLVMGGAVKGGRIHGDWPGLAQLQDDRDLRVATDARSVMKGILRDHLGLDAAALGNRVFPGTAALPPAAGLIRT